MQRSIDQAGSRFQSIGAKLTAGISLPIAGAGLVLTKFASDFETSTTKLVTLSGVSEQQMKKMRQAVLDLAPTVGIGPNALSEALLVVTSTGFEGAQAMEILATAAKASAVGMGDTKDIARALTAAISAYGSENLTAARAGDILHATVVAGGAEATELAGEIGRVVGVAANLGVSFEEVGAFIATYTRLGISASEATTGLSGVLNTILSPSKEAKDALDGIGLSADMLRQMVAEQGLGAALGNLVERLHGNAEATGALFGNVRALAGVLGTAGVQGAGYAEVLDQIHGANSNLNAAFEETKKTAAFQWSVFKAEAEKLAITLGTQLLPALTGLLTAAKPVGEWLAKAVQWFAALPQPVQTTVFAVLGLLAALGPVAFAFGTVLKAGAGIASLVTWVMGLGSAGGALATAWTSVMGVITPIGGIVTALVTAFGGWAVLLGGALLTAIVAIGLKTGALQAIFSGVWDVVKGTVSVFADLATVLVKGAIYAVSELWGWVSNLSVWSSLGDMLGKTRKWFADLIPDFLLSLVSSVTTKFKEMLDYLHLLAGAGFGDQKGPAVKGPAMFGGTSADDLFKGPKNVMGDPSAIWGTLDGGSAAAAIAKTKDEIAKAKREAEAWAKEMDRVTGRAAVADADAWMKKLQAAGGVTHLTADAQHELHDAISKAIPAAASLGVTISAGMLAAWQATDDLGVKLNDLNLGDVVNTWGEQMAAFDISHNAALRDALVPKLPTVSNGIDGIDLSAAMVNPTAAMGDIAHLYVSPFRTAFDQLGKDLPNIIFGALQNGGSIIGSVAAGIGAQFSKQFQAALEKAGGDLSKVSGSNRALGIAGGAISAAFTGYDLGSKLGKGKGALAGAASGALAGSAAGPLGMLVGGGIGAIAGFFGGRKKDQEARDQMALQREEVLKQFGGMDKLKTLADSLHVSLGNAFTTKKPEEFRAAIEKLNAAIEAHKVQLEGLSEITSGVNARGQAFSASLQANGAQPGSEAEFNRVGAMALGGLGASMAGGAGLLESLTQLQPVLGVLNQAQAEFNFNGSEVTQRLLEMNAAVQANLPTFQALTADGQILNGMIKANWADFGLFSATTADVTAKVTELTAGGMSLNQALSLNQPVLQALWQAQQQFGFATDDATQALLDQAVANGVVGPQMKSTQDQMLDVMKAIAKVLGADIPAALAGLPGAAQNAANGMNAAFSSVKPPSFDMTGMSYDTPNTNTNGDSGSAGPGGDLNDLFPGHFHPGQGYAGRADIPELASGGLVNGRTLAWIGEAGPELVVPLSDFSSMLGKAVSPLSMDQLTALAVQQMGGNAGINGWDGGSIAYGGDAAMDSRNDWNYNDPVPQFDTPSAPVPYADRTYSGNWQDRIQTGRGGQPLTLELDGDVLGRVVLPAIARESRRLGLVT